MYRCKNGCLAITQTLLVYLSLPLHTILIYIHSVTVIHMHGSSNHSAEELLLLLRSVIDLLCLMVNFTHQYSSYEHAIIIIKIIIIINIYILYRIMINYKIQQLLVAQ